MVDVSLAYAAAVSQDGHVFVVGPDQDRLCEIPLLARATDLRLRSLEERMSIARRFAQLLNEESARCRG